MEQSGCKAVAMEATSHGLHQRRMEGLRFKAAIFTNLSHEHLDYHKTMENYVAAKAMLFKQCDVAIINKDAEYIREILDGVKVPAVYFGIGDGDGYFAKDVALLPDGVGFTVKGQKFRLNIPGKFSVYNALSAIAAACEMGVPINIVAEGIEKIKGVPGRFERLPGKGGINVIVDYAHTADSLENIISSVREFTEGKVITVFGCGGERDRQKRPEMGKVAGSLSDIVVITSDNPRGEVPMDIINEIIPGVKGTDTVYMVEEDRRKAIETAIGTARPGDAVIIAGKGHEPYMEFENRRRIPFSDTDEARKVLDALNP
jgi:UDP-N-acetylmuramyl-tripeptide synthetase